MKLACLRLEDLSCGWSSLEVATVLAVLESRSVYKDEKSSVWKVRENELFSKDKAIAMRTVDSGE